MSALETEGVRQEDDVVPGRRITAITAVAAFVALGGVAVATLLLRLDTGSVRAEAAGLSVPPARRIAGVEQTAILTARDGLDLRDRQREELSRAAWIDRDAGIAALPIDVAMDAVVRAEAQRR
ncbi:MAG TPA: hypothetical protein VHV30_09285 [Polyangiaceae bacterium]|jgi:hypothetical protein|nr:hypothetical protein [Polyangiaceae bacterium]